LLYALEQGPTEKAIIDACIAQRRPLPEAIANAPSLLQGLEQFYEAFMRLSTCRQLGYGAEGPIPWWCVALYARERDYDEEEQYELEHHVSEMDTVYLTHRAKAVKKAASKPPAAKDGKTRTAVKKTYMKKS
jgi:hypothetical protein